MSQSKKPFEYYLNIVESTLECKLFNWQKEALYRYYNGERPHLYIARGCGMTTLDQAIIILCMEMGKEN